MNKNSNVLTLIVIWFEFIISIVVWVSSYIVVGESETWTPRFCNMGLSHWTIFVAKFKVRTSEYVEWDT